jgi:hypothetical protein
VDVLFIIKGSQHLTMAHEPGPILRCMCHPRHLLGLFHSFPVPGDWWCLDDLVDPLALLEWER